MKFEDLKLPDLSGPSLVVAIHAARAVYDQMRAHYEADKHPAPEWRLPDPPPGQQWHRDDWTQDMLPEGYRPLLLGEPCNANDFFFDCFDREWRVSCAGSVGDAVQAHWAHTRTRRPLPEPVEYVPLEPGDVPPGSAVRKIGNQTWRLVTRVEEDCFGTSAGTFDWCDLAERCEILRPGSTTWEPCKKPKA